MIKRKFKTKENYVEVEGLMLLKKYDSDRNQITEGDIIRIDYVDGTNKKLLIEWDSLYCGFLARAKDGIGYSIIFADNKIKAVHVIGNINFGGTL